MLLKRLLFRQRINFRNQKKIPEHRERRILAGIHSSREWNLSTNAFPCAAEINPDTRRERVKDSRLISNRRTLFTFQFCQILANCSCVGGKKKFCSGISLQVYKVGQVEKRNALIITWRDIYSKFLTFLGVLGKNK